LVLFSAAVREHKAVSAEAVALVPFTPGHYATLSSWFADEHELVQWGGANIHYPLDVAQLDGMLPDRRQPVPAQLAWMARRAGDLIGHVQLMAIDADTGLARVARVAIAPAHRGHGLAIPMLTCAISEAFAIPGIEQVDLGVYTWNVGAITTYERLGFQPGPITHGSVHVAGVPWDLQEMSLSRDRFHHAS
jgi:RimJ/RimL family protein N-acetyltransferase